MNMDDPTSRLLRLSSLDFTIIHRPGRVHQVPGSLSRLHRDIEPHFLADEDEIPTFADASVFRLLAPAATKDTNATATDTIVPPDVDTDDDLDKPTDDDELELDAIVLYQTTYLEACMDPDHLDLMDNINCDLLHNSAAADAPSSTPVADVPVPVTVSEVSAAQKTDNFCETVFATM